MTRTSTHSCFEQLRITTCLLLLLTSTSGCAVVTRSQSWLDGLFNKEPDFSEQCTSSETDRFVEIGLDSNWVSDWIDCPKTGLSTIGYRADVDAPRLVTLRIEVLSGDGPLTVRHSDGTGSLLTHLASSPAREAEFGLAIKPDTAIFVSSPGEVRYRIRNLPEQVRTHPSQPKPRRDAPPAPVAVEVVEPEHSVEQEMRPPEAPTVLAAIQPPPPGTQRVGMVSRIGDPVRQLRLDAGTERGVQIGQQGRLQIDGKTAGQFCIDETFVSSSTARMRQPLPESLFAQSASQQVDIATRESRPMKLLRGSGNPILELEFQGGRRDCLQEGMRGHVLQNGERVASFKLRRVESNRAWATLDEPLASQLAVGATYSLDLASDSP